MYLTAPAEDDIQPHTMAPIMRTQKTATKQSNIDKILNCKVFLDKTLKMNFCKIL